MTKTKTPKKLTVHSAKTVKGGLKTGLCAGAITIKQTSGFIEFKV